MEIVGVKLRKPTSVDFAVIAFWAIIGGMVGAFVLMPVIGGSWKHIIGMVVSAAIAGLAATCGASFDKAGLRGLLLCVAVGILGYVLVVSL